MAEAARDAPGDAEESGSTHHCDNGGEPRVFACGMRTAGIENLGNTCFMNTSLQCLASIPRFRDYFCTDRYMEAIESNRSALALSEPEPKENGKLAAGVAALLKSLWDVKADRVHPADFMRLVGDVDSRFRSVDVNCFEQHDAMEFVEFLLDSLKEECNSVKKQPTSQTEGSNPWSCFQVQNDSEIAKLFAGCFRTTTTCPDPGCGHVSTVLDPFMSIKLPVASSKRQAVFVVTVVPLVSSGVCAAKREFVVDLPGSVSSFIDLVAVEAGLRVKSCILCEMWEGRLKVLKEDVEVERIAAAAALFLYELEEPTIFKAAEDDSGEPSENSAERRVCPDDSKDYSFRELREAFKCEYSEEDLKAYWRDAMGPLVQEVAENAQSGVVVHCRKGRDLIGIPMIFCARRKATKLGLVEAIRLQLELRFGPDAASGWSLYQGTAGWDAAKASTLIWRLGELGDSQLGLREREHLVVDWQGEVPLQILDARPLHMERRRVDDLQKCFEWFTEVEQLTEDNALQCDKCQARQQSYRKVTIAVHPPVLALQLKRFQYNSFERIRCNHPICFPLEGLDLSGFSAQTDLSAETCLPLYDLIAVSKHIGTAQGGHYVAHARSSEDGQWRYFDDSFVRDASPEEVEGDLVGSYLLFYLRRDCRPASWGPPQSRVEASGGDS
eukprot:gnl/TRDRNA2_/TRDRNA2_164064_c0_seq4.p1 gnl/TRDRNA2_/TRDRNA2_164064_c0~~gnl/TRDRNA2_/TRDRNA2_164064_c0_seq4.p1  ORF type:complete len:683 (+),score=118.04 gnl/TRDRNA2_/TRDRNA2_164064_c0_seq4:48-2051(+)